MGSYVQWRKGYPSGCRLLYVCGEDKALVSDVLKSELAYRPINDLDYVELDGKTDSVQDIMLDLDQFAKNGYRLVVIRNADQIKTWGPIIDWTKSKQMKGTTLICVGEESKPDTKQDQYRPFIENPHGRFVDCKPLKEEQLLALIQSSGKFTPEAANTLVYRSGGSTAKILNELKKLAYLPPPITVATVDTYVTMQESERLAEALFSNNKRLAMQIVSSLDEKEFSFVAGSLEYALYNLVPLILLRDKHMELRDLAERSGVPLFLLGTYLKWGKGLTTTVLYRRIKLLAQADAYHRKGYTTGVLERLVSQW